MSQNTNNSQENIDQNSQKSFMDLSTSIYSYIIRVRAIKRTAKVHSIRQ